jgi:hypothetical protein
MVLYIALLCLGVLLVLLITRRAKRAGQESTGITQFRIDADEQFRGLRVSSNVDSLAFDGSEAEIVSQEEHMEYAPTGGPIIGYSITRYAINRAGEYFMFKSNIGARPFIKHVPQNRASIVLKDKYRAPGAPIATPEPAPQSDITATLA